MKFFKQLFKGQPDYKIISSEESMKLYKGEFEKDEILWGKVIEIRAFKRDHLAYDCICLGFHLSDNTTFEIDEEIEGYKETVELLPQLFEGIEENWFPEVAFPAFETNMTIIWTNNG